jgi:tRNA threonylcarbamoyl adenosine modification protein (Sua5/YciO/YrdC/YwlC family)
VIVSEAGACAALREGRVVAVPTDTVYGLAVDPSLAHATAALFALKGRPETQALPVLVADAGQARALAAPGAWTPALERLAARWWPGALTVVVARRAGLDWDLGGDPATIGLRVPAAEPVRRLCREAGPVAATSANRHGEPPLTTAAHVVACFGAELPVLDGGRCDAPPSTVVDLTGTTATCLRQGAIAWEEIAELL